MTEPVGTNETSAGLVETRGNGAAERLAFDPSVFDQETPDDLMHARQVIEQACQLPQAWEQELV